MIAVVGSNFLPKVGPRAMMTTGALLATAGMIWLIQLKQDSSYWTLIMPAFVVLAFGMACVFVPLGNTALTGVANHDAGVASAMVNTSQQIGGSLGVALLNTVFTTAVTGYVTSHAPSREVVALAKIHGYNVAFTVSAALLGFSAILIFLLIRRDRNETTAAVVEPAVHVG